MKGIGIRLDQKNRYKISMEKPDDLVCQTGQFGFVP
jgi:hypothetical protein